MRDYTERFFETQREGSRRSAKEIVPLIVELIQPKRVIDVGCGTGSWLSVFQEHGIEDIWGVDGDYVDETLLQIPSERFIPHNLRKPLRMDIEFDLVVSLEVAEHLPENCAAIFVDSLTRLGPIILFSAAIPHQQGTSHVNEQWPEYWVAHFQDKGYSVVDCIRGKIWNNDRVEFWYAQNMLFFIEEGLQALRHRLNAASEDPSFSPLSIVHPKKY